MATGISWATIALTLTLSPFAACGQAPRSGVAGTEFHRAETTFERGDLKQALSEVDSALREKTSDPDETWRLRLLECEIFIQQGRSQEALALLNDQTLPEPRSAELMALRSTLRGVAETNLQQFDLADQTFRATEQMAGASSPKVMGELLLGEGKLAAMRRDASQSELLFKRALKIAQEHDQTFLAGRALGNLGMLQMQQYHYADAVDRFNASLAVAEKLGAQATIVRTANNLGWAYEQMGDLDRAIELFKESEKKSESFGMLADQETALIGIAAIQQVRRDYSHARESYQHVLQLARQLQNKQKIVFTLTDLAQIAIVENDFRLAERYDEEALPLARSLGDHDTEQCLLVNEAQIALSRGDQRTAGLRLGEVVHGSKANLYLQALAFSTMAMNDAKLNHVQAAVTHYNAAIHSLEKGRASFEREEFKFSYPVDAKTIYDEYIDFLVRGGRIDEAFRVVEMHRASTLTEGLGLNNEHTSSAFDVAAAKRFAARSGHVILSYWMGPEHSYLWIFLPGHSQFVQLAGEDRIRPLIEKYQSHLLGAFDSSNLADSSGQELYSILIGSVERWIKPQSRITIIPDGPLCGLNFETLLVKNPTPHYWIEDVSITSAGSALLLTSGLRSTPRFTAPPKMLLLIGNPHAPEYYSPLAHAGEEMRLIQDQFRPEQETIIAGADATPAAYFRTKPENYALIHFVAHGTTSRASALDSAVVLSEDGKSHNLYARDIAGTPLRARLVTISACDSAGNRIYSSEGLVGLSWAFLRAGAQKVIAALWEVNDASTPQLMNRMYAAIAAGEEPAAALRAAKLSLLHSQSVYRRPFYWAPFVLYEGA